MKASELRIGNFVLYTRLGDSLCTVNRSNLISFEEGIFKPIPLTEEWLLKLDFEKDKERGRHGYRYSIGHQDFRYVISKDWRETTSHHFGIWYTDSPIESDLTEVYNFAEQIIYVHQLQNLYFALTGEELTYSNKI